MSIWKRHIQDETISLPARRRSPDAHDGRVKVRLRGFGNRSISKFRVKGKQRDKIPPWKFPPKCVRASCPVGEEREGRRGKYFSSDFSVCELIRGKWIPWILISTCREIFNPTWPQRSWPEILLCGGIISLYTFSVPRQVVCSLTCFPKLCSRRLCKCKFCCPVMLTVQSDGRLWKYPLVEEKRDWAPNSAGSSKFYQCHCFDMNNDPFRSQALNSWILTMKREIRP